MLEITILNPNQYVQLTLDQHAIRLGSNPAPAKNDVIIDDPLVSGFQCLIERVDKNGNQHLNITNLGASMVLGSSLRMHHRVTREIELPCVLGAGDTVIQISSSTPDKKFDYALQTMDPIGTSCDIEQIERAGKTKIEQSSPSPETLSSWFEALGTIQRCTAGESSFFTLAARSVFNPGGMDGCIVLMKNGTDWQTVAQFIPNPANGIFYRKDLVNKVYETKKPIYHDNQLLNSSEPSAPHAAVVCPVFDDQNEVTAMVYGFRNSNSNGVRRGIRNLEAKFVNLITDSISAGMIRLNHEAKRARQRVLLERAFSPEVARHLETNPDFLNGRETEVTVLFADLRGFCEISESIGPTLTYQLLTDVLNRFTKIVHQHKGVIIDFYGDGMAAFWNAPVEQPDHPLLACQAGTAICEVMNEINEAWAIEIGQRMRVGVGIHTGYAQVGNSGSQNRLKYGPQGTTVNIASRLEQATKKLGVSLVVSSETAARVTDQFTSLRVCSLQLAGIQHLVDAMILINPGQFAKCEIQIEQYEQGLELFESEKYLESLEAFTILADSDFGSLPLEFILNELNTRTDHEATSVNETLAKSTTAIRVG